MRTSEQWVEEVMENVDQYFMSVRDKQHDDFPVFVCVPRKALEELISISDHKHD